MYLADGTTQVTLNSFYTLTEIRGLQFQPTANKTGTTGFAFNVADSGGTANGGLDYIQEFMLITITAVNDAPVLAAIGNQSVAEGATLSFTASATDADVPAQSLSYSLDAASLALGMSINANTGVFSWTPTEAQGGLAPSVTVTVTDNGTGTLTDSETFTITVGDTNLAPVLAAIGNLSVNEGTTLSFTASATDADLPAQNLTFSLDGASIALGMNIDANTGVFSWTPTESQGGLAPSVTITVTDNGTGDLRDARPSPSPSPRSMSRRCWQRSAIWPSMKSHAEVRRDGDRRGRTGTDVDLFPGRRVAGAGHDDRRQGRGVFSGPRRAQGGRTPTVTSRSPTTAPATRRTRDVQITSTIQRKPVLTAIGNQGVNEEATLSVQRRRHGTRMNRARLELFARRGIAGGGDDDQRQDRCFRLDPDRVPGWPDPTVTIAMTDNGTGQSERRRDLHRSRSARST